MPRVHRVGDIDSVGHVSVTGSPNVYVENKLVHRNGDIDNDGNIAFSSRTVFANGEPIVTNFDIDSEGHLKIDSARTVYIG
jgi:uncharacterized Zn-binding protein involved in type VI secretion